MAHTPALLGPSNLQWAVVFAQLLIGGTNHGIHGFLVPIRNKQVRVWSFFILGCWAAVVVLHSMHTDHCFVCRLLPCDVLRGWSATSRRTQWQACSTQPSNRAQPACPTGPAPCARLPCRACGRCRV